MALPEVETSPLPSAGHQTSLRWAYGQHDRSHRNAGFACSFASVVLPLFWKAKLDSVQYAFSAEGAGRRPPQSVPEKSATTEDLALFGIDCKGAPCYNYRIYDRQRQHARLGALAAVRSEGDLRCKYSAAFLSARSSDARAERLKSERAEATSLSAKHASTHRESDMQRGSQRTAQFQTQTCVTQHPPLCAGAITSPRLLRDMQHSYEGIESHSVTALADGLKGETQRAQGITALRATASPPALHWLLQSRFPAKAHTEDTLQNACYPAKKKKSDDFASVDGEPERMNDMQAGRSVEDVKRTEVERAHNRMKEHMTDMLRFIDRMEAKHTRRRTTAAFRLRAAKVSEGPVSYAALRCLTGTPESFASWISSSATAAAPAKTTLMTSRGQESSAAKGMERTDAKQLAAEVSMFHDAKRYSGYTKAADYASALKRGNLTAAAASADVDFHFEHLRVEGQQVAAATRGEDAAVSSPCGEIVDAASAKSGSMQTLGSQTPTHSAAPNEALTSAEAEATEVEDRHRKGNPNYLGEARDVAPAARTSRQKIQVSAGREKERSDCAHDLSHDSHHGQRLITSGNASTTGNRHQHSLGEAQAGDEKIIHERSPLITRGKSMEVVDGVENHTTIGVVFTALQEKEEGNAPERRPASEDLYGNSLEAEWKCKSLPGAAGAQQHRTSFNEIRLHNGIKVEADDNQADQVPDRSVSCTVVPRVRYPGGDCESPSRETARNEAEQLRERPPEPIWTWAEVPASATKGRGALSARIELPVSLADGINETAKEEKETNGEERKRRPLVMVLREEEGSGCELQALQGKRPPEGLFQEKALWTKHAPCPSERAEDLVEQCKRGAADKHDFSSAADQPASFSGGKEGSHTYINADHIRPPSVPGTERVGEEPEVTLHNDGKEGPTEKIINTNFSKKTPQLSSSEAALLGKAVLRAAQKIFPARSIEAGYLRGRAKEKRGIARVVEGAKQATLETAKIPAAAIESFRKNKAEKVVLKEKSERAEVGEPTQKKSSSTVRCSKRNLSTVEAGSNGPFAVKPPSLEAGSTSEKGHGRSFEIIHSSSSLTAVERDPANSGVVKRVYRSNESCRILFPISNTPSSAAFESVGEESRVRATVMPPESSSSGERRRVEKKPVCGTVVVRGGKTDFENGNDGEQITAFGIVEDNFPRQRKAFAEHGYDVQIRTQLSGEEVDMTSHTGPVFKDQTTPNCRAASASEAEPPKENGLTQAYQAERAKGWYDTAGSPDTVVTRVGSRASSFPSSFGSSHSWSREDILEKDSSQTYQSKKKPDFPLQEEGTARKVFQGISASPSEGPAKLTPAQVSAKPCFSKKTKEPVATSAAAEKGTAGIVEESRQSTVNESSQFTVNEEANSGPSSVDRPFQAEEKPEDFAETASFFFPYHLPPDCGQGPSAVQHDACTSDSDCNRVMDVAIKYRPAECTGVNSEARIAGIPTFDSSLPRDANVVEQAAASSAKACAQCGGEVIVQLPIFATAYAPFLRNRGRGGAYATKELLMLSGGFWHGRSTCPVSFWLEPRDTCQREPAFLESEAAGKRARAVQENLFINIQQEMRLSRARMRSMFYWPQSFVRAGASALHTKATMMAGRSLVEPLRGCSECESCCYCLPDATIADHTLTPLPGHLNLVKKGRQPRCSSGPTTATLRPFTGSKEWSGFPCLSREASFEDTSLVKCFPCDPVIGHLLQAPPKLISDASSVVGLRIQQHTPPPVQWEQHENDEQHVQLQQPLKDVETGAALKQREPKSWPRSAEREGEQPSLSNFCFSAPVLPAGAFSERHRPPLIARWSLADAEVVEVAGTFSPSPWKDLYRMHWDPTLGGFALDLYSVAPRDMLLQQERFVGLRVDNRHEGVLPRGWWICPLFPKAKEEALLQIAIKFRVDGVWRCEPMLPIHRDEQGRAVNVLVVYQGQHVTAPQVGQTQFSFQGLDLSPVTYNPSRSPAYQTDGPMLVRPSLEDMELEDRLMSHHRNRWNPPSHRPLMSGGPPPRSQASALWGRTEEEAKGANGGDAEKREEIQTEENAREARREREEKASEEKATRDQRPVGEAREENSTVDESSKAHALHSPPSADKSPRTQSVRHDDPEQQAARLLIGEDDEAAEEAPRAEVLDEKFGYMSGFLKNNVERRLRETKGDSNDDDVSPQQQVSSRAEQKWQGRDGATGTAASDEDAGNLYAVAENKQQQCESAAATTGELCLSPIGEGMSDVAEQQLRQGGLEQGDCVETVCVEAGTEEKRASQKRYEKEKSCLLRENETSCATNSAAESVGKVRTACYSPSHVSPAQAPAGQLVADGEKPIQLPADELELACEKAAGERSLVSTSIQAGGTSQGEEMRLKGEKSSGSSAAATKIITSDMDQKACDAIALSLVKEDHEKCSSGSASLSHKLLKAIPVAAAARSGRESEQQAGEKRSGLTKAQENVLIADASIAQPLPGTAQIRVTRAAACGSSSAVKEGKAVNTSTPRLERGFSAYGSTLGGAAIGGLMPIGEGDRPVRSPAFGVLRRVSTLSDSCWPTRVTRYLQTPLDVFHELSGLDVAERRTPAEGARMKKGLTLQCGSFMIPHPDKTESGGADAFFIATPVPPSSRYSKRFACMDIPLARSSTPPLRSIPALRQQGRNALVQAKARLLDGGCGSSVCKVKLPPSGVEPSDDTSAPTTASVTASPTPSTSSCLISSSDASSPESCLAPVCALRFSSANSLGVPAVGRQEVGRSAVDGSTASAPTRASVSADTSSHTVSASFVDPVAQSASTVSFSTERAESSCEIEFGKELPEDEASAVHMLLREAFEENANTVLAQVLSTCPLPYGGLSSNAAKKEWESRAQRYSVSSTFICAGAAACTPPRRPAGAPLVIAGGYGSAAKGVVIGSGGELKGGAACVGVADGVGEWDSFGLNPRLFAEELMRGCWEAAHEDWFWETPAVETRAQEILKRGYNTAKSFGSCTALVACLDTKSQKLGIANLGDSGIIILRRQHQPRLVYSKMTCVHRSREQQHNFNCPYQLSRLPSPSEYKQLAEEGKQSLVRVLRSATMLPQDTPEMADVYTVNVLEGDLIILGTDGVFDNLFDHEICALASAALSPYEAALLNDERLATTADDVAAAVAEAAAFKSRDPLAKTPFMRHARRAQTHFIGGKMDDITVVACWVTRGQLPPDYLEEDSGSLHNAF